MAKLILKKCVMVIRLRVGYMPDGRERCETVRLNGIRPDAGAEQLAAAVRALEPLLDGVITEVRRATEYILEWKGERGEKAAPAAIHAPLINAEERPKFPSSPKKTHSAFSSHHHSVILDIGGMGHVFSAIKQSLVTNLVRIGYFGLRSPESRLSLSAPTFRTY